jgi:hypothetical protein
MGQQRATKGGLARTDATCNGNKTFSLIDAVKKVVEGLLVIRAQKEVSGVGRQIEGVLFESKKRRIHGLFINLSIL